ncbi:MAG: hypothetical protein PHP69_05230 [Candidatus Omnitrophica bacterium]|nr:hypothetical protein [Candidatus Omnitrophota bacterium]MDD5080920.1 hypothetical protein [Candidatus Omnitrophota bacterium]
MPDKPEEKKVSMSINLKKIENNDLFEFTITTPVLRTQFRLPRKVVNELRILIEKALVYQKKD